MGAWALGIVVGGLMLVIVYGAAQKPGAALQRRFVTLGTLAGKTYDEITEACGPPQTRTVGADGATVMQWQATGYHIVLLFDPYGVCTGISHEHVAR